jgi:hypothetical protein
VARVMPAWFASSVAVSARSAMSTVRISARLLANERGHACNVGPSRMGIS